MILDVLRDSFLDTVRLLPFLFLTYLLMEYLEHKTGEKSEKIVRRAGRFGPLIGGVLGVFPQCGFSAAAASFYAGGVISAGTLLAIFLSTSDEMLPIFLSEAVAPSLILKILGVKILLGAITGFAVDVLWRVISRRRASQKNAHAHRGSHEKEIHDLCEHEHCHCEQGSILRSAFLHTLQITVFIFVISLVIGLLVEAVGQDVIGSLMNRLPVVGVLVAAFIGMVPNCAASVIVTQLYLEGILGTAQMIAGLLTGAGVGVLVLCRTNRSAWENLGIVGVLYGAGVFWGMVFEILKITF